MTFDRIEAAILIHMVRKLHYGLKPWNVLVIAGIYARNQTIYEIIREIAVRFPMHDVLW